MPEPALTPLEAARARQYSYEWLGRVLREGVTPPAASVLRQIPALAPLLADPFDADSAAADHQGLFGFNLFPYEGVFLDPDAQLGGPATDRLLRAYGRLGYSPPTASLSGDHLGCQLDLLAFLSAAEADALADDLAPEAARIAGLTRDFLDNHLLRWLAPLQAALAGQANPFYAALGALVAATVLDQRLALGGAPQLPPLPAPPDPLADESARLRDIAAYLLAPLSSGVYLSRDDIAGLARALQLPRGFGNREQMLLNLLRSAAQYDQADALLTVLTALFADRRAYYAAQAAAWPALRPVWQPWETRGAATVRNLALMATQLAQLMAAEGV